MFYATELFRSLAVVRTTLDQERRSLGSDFRSIVSLVRSEVTAGAAFLSCSRGIGINSRV